jgi:transcriptional antiterminator RfaH
MNTGGDETRRHTPECASVTKAWYLVYSKPRQEQVALQNLDQQGYETYLPMGKLRRRRGKTAKIVTEPLFPRYLFIYLCSQTDDWGPIRSTIGVSGLVRFGEQAARVPDGLVEFLKEREKDGYPTHEAKPLEAGDSVRIVEGVAQHYEGVVLARSARDRVNLLLTTSAGFTRTLQVPDAWLERTG